ncbi:MAG: hypothetical protein AAGE84_02610 [Cyanobacteria bacterium P01_G01_bin.39]
MDNQSHERVYRESNSEDAFRTANKGDVIDDDKTLAEKKEQVAVDTWDSTGHVKVPAYFPVEDENGSEEALHHVKDAEEISDVIRQARVDEDGDRKW